jgi:hypothetical protein
MTTILDEIEHEAAERKKSADAAYWRLAKSIARGQRPPANAHHILSEAGKSTTDLRAAAATVEQRFTLAAQLAAAPGLAAEQKELAAKAEAALVALQKAQLEYGGIVSPIQNRLAEIESATLAAEHARTKLINTCPYAALVEELEEVRQKIRERTNRIAEVTRYIDNELKENLRFLSPSDGASQHVGMSEAFGTKQAERDKQAAALRADAAAAAKEIDLIQSELPGLRADEERLVAAAMMP